MRASTDEIVAFIKQLTDTFSAGRGTSVDGLSASYAELLSEFDAVDINTVVRRLRNGQIKEASDKWLPTPPQLSSFIRKAAEERLEQLRPSGRINLRPQPVHISVEGEQARMRLKMPMLQYAEGNSGRQEGLQSMIVLASSWGVAIPKELEDHIAEVGLKEAEKLWRKARKSAWQGIEESPPPFLVTRKKMLEKWGAFPVVEEDVSYDRWLSKKGKWPVGATWVSALGTVYLDTRMKGAGGMA